ncbi:putative S-adenosyl-L-methionine-dependent methyltransferase [Macleaya cordata]|uniref:Putative S-adenosyl-L-methionine-dependent methyltransferase n=1 Tax=Macleaya cordata TaxID=56857 RepID=A0A200PZN5_MACCD|nr:putative S-adenosyl-L-methionine-dependent methyltransferase [Macleaya cordata]
MGCEEDYPRKQHQQQYTNRSSKLKILLLLIFSNLFTIYILTTTPSLNFFNFSHYTSHHNLPLNWDIHTNTNTTSDDYLLLQKQLNTTQSLLAASEAHISQLQQQLISTNSLLETLLSELGRFHNDDSISSIDERMLTDELKLAILPHKLPLGYSPRMGSDSVHPPVGAGCLRFKDELNQYMKYNVGGECPVDDVFAQRLMLKGCEPLPRRRCHPKSPVGYVEPTPFPASLWTTPPDNSIIWDPYSCKNYRCLVERENQKGYFDCKDCFNLQGREKTRWLFDNGGLDYGIDEILRIKPAGTIRIGFDIGGGTGTFAARMRERNVTIITSSMNLDGPFNSFIASRGLISMHISVSQRLPFFENTLDIVHSMHVLSNWIPDAMLEFTLYDIYRVLRPGGLFWLDRFFCLGSQLNATYVPMFNRIGFKKLRWNAGMKFDRGAEKNEWYFSALLEKPMI